MSPVAPIAHLIAIVAGVLGGFWVAGWVAPDLPAGETAPGVAAGEEVRGGDPDSLFRPGPLAEAIAQTEEQSPAGQEVSNVTIEPGTLRAAAASGPNVLPLSELPVDAPERILDGIRRARSEAGVEDPVDLDDVLHMSWSPANPTESEWSTLLDVSTAGPPTEFEASRDGSRVRVG
jgi:hypothetical protein